ncbi:MAG: GTPase HflX [Actinobacteria bacterium]|nr:GTPase HflX [Actinomycetota bacterium]
MSRAHLDRQRRRLTATETDLGVVRQRALLVGTGAGTRSAEEAEASLEELALLADTAGADAVASELQRRDLPDPATYIGKGKAREIAELAEGLDVDVVIFDDELSPAQQRNLEQLFERDVVDRVALILDIFAQHAASQEGMLQVELAQLRYRLPRLRGRGITLSQQGAGIGTRGPGETQLEVDRRRIQRRITKLEHDLVRLGKIRATQRKARDRRALTTVALVGYTNAGKSTLLNRCTHAHSLVEDRLFSTLDPTTRRLRLAGGETVLLSDTVGFVRRLPHQLVEAFRSTLEEVCDADYLVHLVDAGAPEPYGRIEAVRTVLREIGAGGVPELLVFTKSDRVSGSDLASLLRSHPDSVGCSARTGEGVDAFVALLGERLRALEEVVELRVPYDRCEVLASLHREGEVLVEVYEEGGTRVRARLPDAVASRYRDLVANPPATGEPGAAAGGR